VEDVVQDVVDPDVVERSLRQARGMKWSADESGPLRDPVDRGALPRQLDGPGRHVESGHVRAEPGQDHRVLALSTADVENVVACEVAEDAEAVLLRVEQAGPAVSR